jgi:branched-chain amino acid transport system ATP-binding protein
MLKVSALNTYYGHQQILRDVSLEVNDGELVTLIGANGNGKSTLLMAISGMIKKCFGTIEFRGTRIDGLTSNTIVRLGIIQVPQGRLLFPDMTVLENLELGTRGVTDFKRKSMKQSLEEVFGLFKVLYNRRRQKAGTLSGGEQQMLAIARGLMGRPRLLMLDEPSFGLSPIMVEEVGRVLKDLHETGLSILLVEQNAYLALELADRGYVLESGTIVASGKACELAESQEVRTAYLGI